MAEQKYLEASWKFLKKLSENYWNTKQVLRLFSTRIDGISYFENFSKTFQDVVGSFPEIFLENVVGIIVEKSSTKMFSYHIRKAFRPVSKSI